MNKKHCNALLPLVQLLPAGGAAAGVPLSPPPAGPGPPEAACTASGPLCASQRARPSKISPIHIPFPVPCQLAPAQVSAWHSTKAPNRACTARSHLGSHAFPRSLRSSAAPALTTRTPGQPAPAAVRARPASAAAGIPFFSSLPFKT